MDYTILEDRHPPPPTEKDRKHVIAKYVAASLALAVTCLLFGVFIGKMAGNANQGKRPFTSII